jgi:DNA-binding transcriptional MerR regulator
MQEDGLTLEELSGRTGVEARTLRSWVSEGLLLPPFRPGRGARYPAGNAERALAVRVLKELHGLSMSEIGRRFMMATEEQVREWASEMSPTQAPRGSARDYLRHIQAEDPDSESVVGSGSGSAYSAKPAPSWFASRRLALAPEIRPGRRERDAQKDLANIERLILRLEEVLDAPAPRRSRGAVWTRISVTPDFEFAIRGHLEPRERALFEQVADQFRAILMGGTKHD